MPQGLKVTTRMTTDDTDFRIASQSDRTSSVLILLSVFIRVPLAPLELPPCLRVEQGRHGLPTDDTDLQGRFAGAIPLSVPIPFSSVFIRV